MSETVKCLIGREKLYHHQQKKKECSLGHILIQLHIKEGDFRKGSGLYSKVSGWSAGHAFVQGGVATGH